MNVTFFGDLNLNGNSIINVSKLLGANGQWQIDENGKLVVKEIETEKLKVTSPAGFTIFDEDTGQPVCVKSKSLVLTLVAGECGTVPASSANYASDTNIPITNSEETAISTETTVSTTTETAMETQMASSTSATSTEP